MEARELSGFGQAGVSADNSDLMIGRPALSTIWQGMRWRAVGSRLWPRPVQEPFHQFLILGVLEETLGPDWLEAEWMRSADKQHPVATWLQKYNSILNGPAPTDAKDEGNGVWSINPDGSTQSLVCLAYDIYLIQHTSQLPERLLKRLRHPDQFQGVAYELHAASLFARLGHKIEWVHSPSETHFEFVARNPATGEQIAVEAKSKHRDGILGFRGTPKEQAELQAGAVRLLTDAIEKAPNDLPYVIFVDLNLPVEADGVSTRLLEEVQTDVARLRKTRLLVPEPWSAIVLTNNGWHWSARIEGPGAHIVVIPEWSRNPLASETIALITEAVKQDSWVPHDDELAERSYAPFPPPPGAQLE